MTDPVSHIAGIPPYALADLSVPSGMRMLSMAQNESLRPPSPSAVQAATDALSGAALYPDPDWTDLRHALSEIHEISGTNILCGAGSMELIACIAHAFLGPEDEVVTTEYAYAFIKTVAQFTNAEFKAVPETDRTVSVDAIIKGVSSKTKIVFVANPGNPTGTRITSDELRRLRAHLAPEILLVIDEAYGEFCDGLDERLFYLCTKTNTVVLRTFSKAYGLAGMRVGWGCFPEKISGHVRKLLNPNNVSVASQAAATAAFIDQEYMMETCRITKRLGELFCRRARELGLQADTTHTNFVLLRFPDDGVASNADGFLKERGVLMRQMGGYGLSDCLRATMVGEEDLNFALQALRDFCEKGGLDG